MVIVGGSFTGCSLSTFYFFNSILRQVMETDRCERMIKTAWWYQRRGNEDGWATAWYNMCISTRVPNMGSFPFCINMKPQMKPQSVFHFKMKLMTQRSNESSLESVKFQSQRFKKSTGSFPSLSSIVNSQALKKKIAFLVIGISELPFVL